MVNCLLKKKIATAPDNVSICDEKEELIMINPARIKNSEFSISFNKECEIKSDNFLMQNTIEICKLNREDLSEKRLKVYQEFENIIYEMKRFIPVNKQLDYVTEKLIKPIQNDKQLSYIALRKFIVKKWLGDMIKQNG